MNIPKDLHYTREHEWLRLEGDEATVGITDFAQGELGDVVFVQLPEIGTTLKKGQAFGTIEAVKAVADIYAPLSGKVVAVNSLLTDKPELMNKDPYGEGWVAKLKLNNLESERSELLSPDTYGELTQS